ncbi:MAG: MFS transporter [Deltaproteobacteria bacterium]|nr:MAG: MFS transporter [Deltaproteobacteria bacterium]
MTKSRLDPRIWRMAFARAVNTMGLSLVMSFLGIYVVETRGYPAWSYGVIALVANLGQSMSNAWAGNLSDRIGRRPLITAALFVRAGFIALLGTQVLLDAPLWTLGANMVVTSTLRGCFGPVAYALVADVARDDQRVAAFGIQRMGTNVGWAVGPALGGVLTLVIPYGAVFYFAAAGLVAAGFVALGVEDPARATRPAAPPSRGSSELLTALDEALADRAMQMMLLGTFLCALLETQMFSTFSIYMTEKLHLTKADVGLLYTCNGIGVLILQVPALGLIRRFGIRTMLPWSSFVDTLGFALVGLAAGFAGGALAIVVLTCAEVVFDPAQQAAIAEVADPARRGRVFGVVGFAQMVGIAAAPLLGGVLIDAIGDHHVAMWLAIAAIGGGQTACFAAFVRRRVQAAPPPRAA